MSKYVYFFSENNTDGSAEMRDILGGKGANLAEMCRLNLPVPPGFTISTEVCNIYHENLDDGCYPQELLDEVKENLKKIEKIVGNRFADPENPLLVSIRSGARVSMPGMMDTILNVGLNKNTIKGIIRKTGDKRFAYDLYRRLMHMYSNVVLGMDSRILEQILQTMKSELNVTLDTELTAEHWKEIVDLYEKEVQEITADSFPQDPWVQLWGGISAVFKSWNTQRAVAYREINGIPNDWGTAVNVQAMVFGNMGNDSGTGVLFTRNPSTGHKHIYGEYLINAQGEDLVAGIRTPLPIGKHQKTTDEQLSLEETMPEIFNEFKTIQQNLEKHYTNMLDLEFTIQQKKLWILQCRVGKRTANAAVKIATDMVNERLITKEKAVLRITPEQVEQLLHPTIDPEAKNEKLSLGLPASPGAASGKTVFSPNDAVKLQQKGENVILVRNETCADDISGMQAAQAILTVTGGMTSHAAVVARGMGKPCVTGCGALKIYEKNKVFSIDEKQFKEGDILTIDGSSGAIYEGVVPTIKPEFSGDFINLLEWADLCRKLKVRANADTPHDAEKARKFGAQGIGLCRTEHMFFATDRLPLVRQMVLSNSIDDRKQVLHKLMPYQKNDFYEILKAMEGYPVTIRLLDPPLHEFLPHDPNDIKDLANSLNVSEIEIIQRIDSLKEFNPMLGHRGCRLGITYPEIYEMQVEALFTATCELKQENVKVYPEVMIPLVGTEQEFKEMKVLVDEKAKEIMDKFNTRINYSVGTMIEVPRACLVADKIAVLAEFFSFGTNDLTQMTFGYSRDDSGVFLPKYVEKGILTKDPFQSLDQLGVGQLLKICVAKARKTRKNIKIGICGEHGGDPSSIYFCHQIDLNYVSCSPFRVPVARLAAAHSALKG